MSRSGSIASVAVALSLSALTGSALIGSARAADGAPANCRAPDAPYRNYDCLDKYLGDGILRAARQLLPAGMGARRAARRPQGATLAPRRLVRCSADLSTDAVHRMALRRIDQHRHDTAECRRQPAHGHARQHRARQVDERQPHAGLWLGQRRRQSLDQRRGPRRQLPGFLRLHAQRLPARSGGRLFRAAARHCADRSYRLGLPLFRESTARTTAIPLLSASRAISSSVTTSPTASICR